MKLYAGYSFDSVSDQYRKQIESQVNSETDSYILNVNIDDLTAHLCQNYTLDIPIFHFDKTYVDTVEKDIPGSKFPRHEFYFSEIKQFFRKQVIIYHIPYSGEINLLQLRPNPMTLMSYDATFDTRSKCILIEIINFYDDPDKIKKQFDQEVSYLMSNYSNIVANCEAFNKGLNTYIRQTIEFRKRQILQKHKILLSLGVPIKKKDGVAETFAIPRPQLKEKIIVKPVVYEKNFRPEPSLDENNYHKILRIINDVGKNFERLPSTYKGKSEEDIRDHILLILDPNFELGNAGGETFNKSGKTDISLRYDSSVVFIAECKYWKGEKTFLKTIEQLLGYLTWRNSKVAVINFVQNAEFTDTLEKVKSAARTHPNFLKELRESDETWFNFKFHLNGDRNRELDLAVISFHLPK